MWLCIIYSIYIYVYTYDYPSLDKVMLAGFLHPEDCSPDVALEPHQSNIALAIAPTLGWQAALRCCRFGATRSSRCCRGCRASWFRGLCRCFWRMFPLSLAAIRKLGKMSERIEKVGGFIKAATWKFGRLVENLEWSFKSWCWGAVQQRQKCG